MSVTSEIFVADNAPRGAEKAKIFWLTEMNSHGNNTDEKIP